MYVSACLIAGEELMERCVVAGGLGLLVGNGAGFCASPHHGRVVLKVTGDQGGGARPLF